MNRFVKIDFHHLFQSKDAGKIDFFRRIAESYNLFYFSRPIC